jgi:two-component system response regulator (stage 0 sporulation protein F)
MIKFLVVDDEKGVSGQVKEFLGQRGYAAIAATSGKQALELVKKEEPNIVVLDIVMEGMTGIDVLREIKKMNPKIRVIMLTALEDARTRNICKELGASAYITKPYNFNDILKESHKLINEIYEEEAKN